MADEQSVGVILRTRPLTETSLIVHWLTPDLGRLATVAKGARRPNSPFRGKLDFFYEAEFSFQRSRRSDLHNLREVGRTESHQALRTQLDSLEQAAYFVVLIELTTETETPVPEIYQLLASVLRPLEQYTPRPELVFAFEIKLLTLMGVGPDWDSEGLTEGTREMGRRLLGFTWDEIQRLRLSIPQAAELRQFLHARLIEQIPRLPAGRSRALKCEGL